MPLSTRVSGPEPLAVWAAWAGRDLEPAVRYERSRPGELVHIDVKKLGRIEGGAGKRIRGGGNHYQPTFTDRDGHRPQRPSVGSTSTSPSTTTADSPTRKCSADEKATTDRLPEASSRLLSAATASASSASDRQRLRLPRDHPRACLPRPRHPTPAHQAAPATDQRQSRTLHPHTAQRLGRTAPSTAQARTHRSP